MFIVAPIRNLRQSHEVVQVLVGRACMNSFFGFFVYIHIIDYLYESISLFFMPFEMFTVINEVAMPSTLNSWFNAYMC